MLVLRPTAPQLSTVVMQSEPGYRPSPRESTMSTSAPPSRRSPAVLALLLLLGTTVAWAQPPAQPSPLRWTHADPALTWAPCPPIFPAGCEVTVLHGDPATGPSDVFLRAPADYTFPAHWHTSAEHMVIVAGLVHVTYPGGKQSELPERSYALVPAKMGHKAHCAVGGPCVMFIRFDSPIDAAAATDVP